MLKAIATSSSDNSKLDISMLAGQQRSVFDVKRQVSISSGDSNIDKNADSKIQNELIIENRDIEVSKRNLNAYEVAQDVSNVTDMLVEPWNPKVFGIKMKNSTGGGKIKKEKVKDKNREADDDKSGQCDIMYERREGCGLQITIAKRDLKQYEKWDPVSVTKEILASCKFFKEKIYEDFKVTIQIYDLFEFFKQCKLRPDYFYYCIINQHHFFLNFLDMIKQRNLKMKQPSQE